ADSHRHFLDVREHLVAHLVRVVAELHHDLDLVDGPGVEPGLPQVGEQAVAIGDARGCYLKRFAHRLSIYPGPLEETPRGSKGRSDRYVPRRWPSRPSGSTGCSSTASRPSRRPASCATSLSLRPASRSPRPPWPARRTSSGRSRPRAQRSTATGPGRRRP